MNSSRIFYVIMALVISLVAISPAWAKKSLSTINDEGMELVPTQCKVERTPRFRN